MVLGIAYNNEETHNKVYSLSVAHSWKMVCYPFQNILEIFFATPRKGERAIEVLFYLLKTLVKDNSRLNIGLDGN